MKNVLWVTGLWPPHNVGIGRPVKLAKYLKRNHDWNPIVLAFGESVHRPYVDYSWEKDTEHLEVHKTKPGDSKLLQETIPIYLRRLGVHVDWWTVPDPWIRWKEHALKEAKYIISHQQIDAVFTSGPPYTCHLVGLQLKRDRPWCPWVVDCRDVWTQTDKSYSIKSQEQIGREEEMEGAVLREADWITVVNDIALEMLRSKFPFIREKSSCITHGYDPEDYEREPLVERTDDSRCMMTYTGTIYGERTKGAEAFLKALKQFYDENPEAPLVVGFIGNCRLAEKTAKELGLWQVHFSGLQDREFALDMQKVSDVLLFILGDSPLDEHASPGKLFDYLGAGKPILAVAPEGVATRILEKVGGAVTAHPSDIDGIAQAIEVASKLESVERGSVEQYDVRDKAREMAEVLEWITE